MKKRIPAGITAAMMLGAMALTAGASDVGTDPQMEVVYEQPTTYTLSIPSDVTLTENGGDTEVGVTDVNTKPDEKVQIKVKTGADGGKVTLTREGDGQTTVVSEVTDSNGQTVSNGTVVAEFQDMDTTAITVGAAGDGTLSFGVIKDGAGTTVKAGKYTGTLVFEGAVVPRS